MMTARTPIILLIDKPVGMGSTDVLRKLKYAMPRELKRHLKIGHIGTLDPFASGLLMVGLGPACRFAYNIHELKPKTYQATGLLGIETDSGDLTGVAVSCDWPWRPEGEYLEHHELRDWQALLASTTLHFMPSYWQAIPHFSAAKFEGRALYTWARQGIKIERPPVERHVHQLRLLGLTLPLVAFEATVSSGTYIRQLWQDWAQQVGLRGHLTQLRRTAIGDVNVEQAMSLEQACETMANLSTQLPCNGTIAIEALLPYPRLELASNEAFRRFLNGARLQLMPVNVLDIPSSTRGACWVYWQGKLIGHGEIRDDAACYPSIVFASRDADLA